MGSTLTHHISRRVRSHPIRGFSIIEVLIALGIVSVIMAVTVSGNSSFNNSILLSQAAYSVATAIRETQSLGVANQSINTNLNTGYGFHLEVDAEGMKDYYVFADAYPTVYASAQYLCHTNENPDLPDAKPGDCVLNFDYDTIVRKYTLQRGIEFGSFCLEYTGNRWVCSVGTETADMCNSGSYVGLDSVSIVFARPSTDAVIRGLASGSPTDFLSAQLMLRSPDGGRRYVFVERTGQVSVRTACP